MRDLLQHSRIQHSALFSPLPSCTRRTARFLPSWPDLAPLHKQLDARGIGEAAFPAYVDRLRQTHASRVREGDLDHLIFYLLQSQAFTTLPALEPALSAKALVEGFEVKEREAFLRTGAASVARVPEGVRARIAALLRALGAPVARRTDPLLRRAGAGDVSASGAIAPPACRASTCV